MDYECVLPEPVMASWCRCLTAAKRLKLVHIFHFMGGFRDSGLGFRV